MTKSIRQLKQKSAHSSQSGFTILESLIAIVVVAILLSAIAPVIVLSVATRVQARRVELGTQAARAYIDGLRSGSITPPPPANVAIDPNIATFNSYAAPTPSALACANNNYCTTPAPTAGLYCFDGNADNVCQNNKPNDLIIQAVRYNSTSVDAARGYLLGVRVYRADAFRDTNTILRSDTSASGRRAQQTFRGTLGQRKSPIIELTTEVRASASYDNFCQRLGGCNQ
ncbi:MAG: hormogonium polysaccharide secretion pseudopilin HpsB [Trichocoleus desertorum ATA4-8-CV12]|jgi:prepilin-type N-terminal cleavage/methylation domain-containing protein|nr:hormogonium polysaccharide secretion pseudopilin HpsB [Trichocoleus desertorum ATA4-8-CV12]